VPTQLSDAEGRDVLHADEADEQDSETCGGVRGGKDPDREEQSRARRGPDAEPGYPYVSAESRSGSRVHQPDDTLDAGTAVRGLYGTRSACGVRIRRCQLALDKPRAETNERYPDMNMTPWVQERMVNQQVCKIQATAV
jgi:hypothetical protein